MINYNGVLFERNKPIFALPNRGLQFGDGIFETIIYRAGEIQFFDLHWQRLTEGLKLLQIDLPFTKDELESQLQTLLEKHKLATDKRIKITLWRSGGGKYTPEASSADYMIACVDTRLIQHKIIQKAAICKTVSLHHHAYSHLKSISALNYVLAAQEKAERNMDELLLLNNEGYLTEATAANLFFYNHGKNCWYTPPLASGCINGVSRRHLVAQLSKHSLKPQEKGLTLNDLHKGVALFATNVAGITHIQQIDKMPLSSDEKTYELIRSLFYKR